MLGSVGLGVRGRGGGGGGAGKGERVGKGFGCIYCIGAAGPLIQLRDHKAVITKSALARKARALVLPLI